MQEDNGKAIQQSIKKCIIEEKEKSVRQKGLVPICVNNFSHQTTRNYMALFAEHPGINLKKYAIKKTETRYTAENSIIAAISFLHLIATTHYVVSDDTNLCDTMNEKIMLSNNKGIIILCNMMKDFYKTESFVPLKHIF